MEGLIYRFRGEIVKTAPHSFAMKLSWDSIAAISFPSLPKLSSLKLFLLSFSFCRVKWPRKEKQTNRHLLSFTVFRFRFSALNYAKPGFGYRSTKSNVVKRKVLYLIWNSSDSRSDPVENHGIGFHGLYHLRIAEENPSILSCVQHLCRMLEGWRQLLNMPLSAW
jgi:hypothetical protein